MGFVILLLIMCGFKGMQFPLQIIWGKWGLFILAYGKWLLLESKIASK